MNATTADYIIVGAGSAGCLLANRLSEDPRTQVILVEAGGSDRNLSSPRSMFRSLMLTIPTGWAYAMNDPAITWGYFSEPEPVSGRVYSLARGRVLGGSSSINGMIHVRGLPYDFDGWRQLGCTGWAWSDVKPVYDAIERRLGDSPGQAEKPLSISPVAYRHPMTERIREAFIEAGIPATEDVNSSQPEGVTYATGTIDKGRRHSSSAAFLHPAMNRPNLQVVTNAVARRVLFDGTRAIGVEIDDKSGRRTLTARSEVILAAGAINSPHLLELSGVGDGSRLAELGIPVVRNSPNVGESLQDHYSGLLTMRMTPGTQSMNSLSKGLSLAGQIATYALNRGGLLSSTPAQLIGLVRSHPDLDVPDLQFFASPATADVARTMATGRVTMEDQPGITMSCYQLRPQSRGSVHARSPDPSVHPAIALNFLSDAMDQQTMVRGTRLSRKILAQPALAPFADHLTSPDPERMSDEEILDYLRATGNTAYHYSCTCAMGGEDAVLTPRLKVRGVDNLRVVDASVMPRLVSGNTNAATFMIAEKAARMIREDARAGA